MAKLGRSYEELVHSIYEAILANVPGAKVTLDEKILGPDGPRQFDVVIRHCLGGMEFLTLVECKDYNSIANVTAVDAFFSKLSDMNASKGVLVTRKGFSKGARQKAARLGIELCLAGPANEVKIDGLTDIPIVVNKMRPWNIGTLWKIVDASQESVTLKPGSPINGVPAMTILLESYARGMVRDVRGHPHEFILQGQADCIVDLEEFFGSKVFLEHGEGNFVEVGSPFLAFRVQESLFFGHTNDLDLAVRLVDLKNNNQNIVIRFNDLTKIHTNLVPVSNMAQVEQMASGVYLYCIAAELRMDDGYTGKLQVWRYPNE